MEIHKLLVVSDLDGTLIPISGVISQNNIDAVHRFLEAGGTFTAATGRSPSIAQPYFEQLSIKTPVIVNNGAAIYDPVEQKNLWWQELPNTFREVVKHIMEAFSEVVVSAVDGQDTHYEVLLHENEHRMSEQMRYTTFVPCMADDLPDACCKIVFMAESEMLDQLEQFVKQLSDDSFCFVRSGGICFEMMAKGISKGAAFKRLVSLCGKQTEYTVAVGDYYNDVEMIENAALGVTLKSGCDAAKRAAKLVVSSCEDDGVAELITMLLCGNMRFDDPKK